MKILLILFASLFGIYALASLFALNTQFSIWGSPARDGGLVEVAILFVITIAMYLFLKEEHWKAVINMVVFAGAVTATLAILQVTSLIPQFVIPVDSRPPGGLGGAVFLGLFLAMILPLPVASLLDKGTKLGKLFYAVSITLILIGIVLSGSRGAFLAVVLGVTYFAWFFPEKGIVVNLTEETSSTRRFGKVSGEEYRIEVVNK